jgi:hypothetical protein
MKKLAVLCVALCVSLSTTAPFARGGGGIASFVRNWRRLWHQPRRAWHQLGWHGTLIGRRRQSGLGSEMPIRPSLTPTGPECVEGFGGSPGGASVYRLVRG